MVSELFHIFRNIIFMLVFSILDQKQSQGRKYNLLYLDIHGELQKKFLVLGLSFTLWNGRQILHLWCGMNLQFIIKMYFE